MPDSGALFEAELDAVPWKGFADDGVRAALDDWHWRSRGVRRRQFSEAEALLAVCAERTAAARGALPGAWCVEWYWLLARPEAAIA